MIFSEDQITAIEGLYNSLDNTRKYEYLQGGAGTGKTSILRELADRAIKKYGSQRVMCLAFTGKAVSRLKEKLKGINVECKTLHSYLMKPVYKNKVIDKWIFRDKTAFEGMIFFIDECSMVSNSFFTFLQTVNAKKVYLGDNRQLPPVGDSHPTVFFTNKPDYELTTIHRQAGNNTLLELAYKYRNKEFANIVNSDDVKIHNKTAKSYEEYHYLQYITYSNNSSYEINRVLRNYFNNVRLSEGTLPTDEEGNCLYIANVGDKIICLDNNSGHDDVFNGSQLIVKEVVDKTTKEQEEDEYNLYTKLIFEEAPNHIFRVSNYHLRESIGNYVFEKDTGSDGKKKKSKKAYYGQDLGVIPFAFGYSITCHKAQGSEWDEVGVVLNHPPASVIPTYFEWHYTAFTRASKTLHLFKNLY